jgi:hypothetical protein
MGTGDEKEKVLCGCGVVFFTAAVEEGGKWVLSETCPGCDQKDNSPQILSIAKIDRKRAAAVIGAVCDLLESEPLQALNGLADRRIRELAQHLEDLGRPIAAGRVLKGWSVLKGSFLKGAESIVHRHPPVSDYETRRTADVKGQEQKAAFIGIALRGCVLCGTGVKDYEKHRETADGILCPKCRTAAAGPELVAALESAIAAQEKALDHMGRRRNALKGRLAEMKAPGKK